MTNYIIDAKNISLSEIFEIVENKKKISLSSLVISNINKSREFLEKRIKSSKKPMYGINTGFGDLHNVEINNTDLNELQSNLIRSHACGKGT